MDMKQSDKQWWTNKINEMIAEALMPLVERINELEVMVNGGNCKTSAEPPAPQVEKAQDDKKGKKSKKSKKSEKKA